MTSGPFWGVSMAHTCYAWGFITLLICLPQYLDDIRHFNLSSVRKKQWLWQIQNGQYAVMCLQVTKL